MRTVAKAIALAKSFEGLKLSPYLCPSGKWTIGYGHTKNVTKDTKPITVEQADTLLKQDILTAEDDVNRIIKVKLSDNEFSALVLFTMNLGGYVLGHGTIDDHLNAGDRRGALDVWSRYKFHEKPDGTKEILPGLVARREKEISLFNEK